VIFLPAKNWEVIVSVFFHLDFPVTRNLLTTLNEIQRLITE